MVLSSFNGTGLASGDLLIVIDRSTEPESYVLAVMPNPAQIRCITYESAVSMAKRWTSLHPARIWFSENGTTAVPVLPTHSAFA